MASTFSWADKDVKLMIRKRIEFHNMFTGKRGSALAGWQHIADILNNGATHQQCKKKWENLLQKYRDIVSPLSKDESVSVKWQFFEDLHPFVSVHQYVNAPLICKPDQEVVTVHLTRSLQKREPTSPSATSQTEAVPTPNSSAPSTIKNCKVEPRNMSAFEDGEVEYFSDLDDISVRSVPESDQVPVIVEISEPEYSATARKPSWSTECRCAGCPLSAHKRPRISEVCENVATASWGNSYSGAKRTVCDQEQHRQVLETLQMEHSMRRNALQTELEMTKRILQVELEIRQEELDFHRTYHRLKLKQLAQNLKMKS